MNKYFALIIFPVLFVFSSLPVLAATPVVTPAAKARESTVRIDQLKTRATREISQRIDSLTALVQRLQLIKRISESDKKDLTTQIQVQIGILNNLSAKIRSGTDSASVRSDVQSITRSYRIYWLFIPKVNVLAAADRVTEMADDMDAVAAKLKTRIDAEKGSATSLNTSLKAATAKIAHAREQAQKASDLVTALQPDNGDTKVLQTNTAALKQARTAIQTAHSDLRTAMQELKKITRSLKITPTPATSRAPAKRESLKN